MDMKICLYEKLDCFDPWALPSKLITCETKVINTNIEIECRAYNWNIPNVFAKYMNTPQGIYSKIPNYYVDGAPLEYS